MKETDSAFAIYMRPHLTQINLIFDQCVADDAASIALTKALASITELEQLLDVISDNQEYPAYKQALQEVQYSLLSASIGNYRHAYSSLRLFFELCLAAVEFSVNTILFRQWLLGRGDIVWARLSNPDDGVISKTFCTLFFPEISDESPHFRTLATTVYRECSQFIHGNPQAASTLPETIQLKKETLFDWANKLDTMCLVITFTYTVRYLVCLPAEAREMVREPILSQLGHLESIRLILGGVVGG